MFAAANRVPVSLLKSWKLPEEEQRSERTRSIHLHPAAMRFTLNLHLIKHRCGTWRRARYSTARAANSINHLPNAVVGCPSRRGAQSP